MCLFLFKKKGLASLLDRLWNQVSLLYDFSGTNNSTVINNKASSGIVSTNNGVVVKTGLGKNNTNVGYFNNSSHLLVPYSAAWLSSNAINWTVEAWVKFSRTGDHVIFSQDKYGVNYDSGLTVNNTEVFFSTSKMDITVRFPSTYAINTWYHYAVVKDGTTISIYRNGVLIGSASGINVSDNSNPITIGCYSYNNPHVFFEGYMNEFRFTRAVRYSGGFVPEFPFKTNVVI